MSDLIRRAEAKLKWIIARCGDEGGARRDPEYLTMLMAEIAMNDERSAFYENSVPHA